MKKAFEISGKQRLRALISFTLAVVAFSAHAACDPAEASITSCTPPPPHGCEIAPPGVPCEDGAPGNDPSSIAGGAAIQELQSYMASGKNIVPRASSNTIQASCSSSQAVRRASAAADLAAYVPSWPYAQTSFGSAEVVIRYSNGQHELWRLWDASSQSNYGISYFGQQIVVGSNAIGNIRFTYVLATWDYSPTCL